MSTTSVVIAGALCSSLAATASARVYATLVLGAVPSSIQTGQLVTFTGTVSPSPVRPGRRVVLQRLVRGRWRHIGGGFPAPGGGAFAITHVFLVPSRGGSTLLRICVRRSSVNFRSCSAPFAVRIVRSTPPNLTARERHRLLVQQARERRQERRLERLRRLRENRERKQTAHKHREEERLNRIHAAEERRHKRAQQLQENHKRKEAARKHKAEERLKLIQAREERRKHRQEEARKRREERERLRR
jgi:flagellar biosynthesis GTPase FlhF